MDHVRERRDQAQGKRAQVEPGPAAPDVESDERCDGQTGDAVAVEVLRPNPGPARAGRHGRGRRQNVHGTWIGMDLQAIARTTVVVQEETHALVEVRASLRLA